MALAVRNIDGGAARQVAPITQAVTRETPRWLFFAGDFPGEAQKEDSPAGGVDFGSNSIVPYESKPGYMHRCLVTPLLRVTHQLFKQETPVGVTMVEAMPGYNPLNGQRTDMVHVFLYPGEEWDWLHRQYSNWGLSEIETLRGKSPDDVLLLKLNTYFFPEWPSLPKTNQELISYLHQRKSFFNKSTNKDIYLAVADEMIAAVEKTHKWMMAHVGAVHGAFRLSEKDSHKRSHYDLTDLHFIEMTGMERIDMPVKDTGVKDAIAALAAQQGGMNAETFMVALQKVLTQNAETVKEALAQREKPVVEETPPKETT